MNDNKITVAQIANLDSSGMCYVIHLSDGTFIIIDGGEADELGAGIYDFNSQALKNHLMSVTGGEKPIISAWFITHFHLDHIDLATRFIKEQNEWLKNYINIHDSNPSLKFTDARVIAREASNYSTVVTFNRGSAHGIKINMPVITADGLIGQVSEVGLDWCRVVTIIEPGDAIGVIVEKTGKLGLLEGSGELHSEGLCKMSYIGDSSGIQMGDRVYTSGVSGSKYPGGLYIGTIVDTYSDANTGELVAIVKPGVDFTELESVTDALIVCGFEG